MARKTVVATLKKRNKSRPMAYVDKQGNVKDFSPKRKKKKHHKLLAKKVVGKKDLDARRALKIVLYVKGKKVMKTKSGLAGSRRRRRRKKKSARRVMRRRAKSRRCPTFSKRKTVRAAKACIRAGKGRTAASKAKYNSAVRHLRRSKAGRSWLRSKKVKMAKGVKKHHKGRRKKSRRKARRRSSRRRRSRR